MSIKLFFVIPLWLLATGIGAEGFTIPLLLIAVGGWLFCIWLLTQGKLVAAIVAGIVPSALVASSFLFLSPML